jgi:hypothetical protein
MAARRGSEPAVSRVSGEMAKRPRGETAAWRVCDGIILAGVSRDGRAVVARRDGRTEWGLAGLHGGTVARTHGSTAARPCGETVVQRGGETTARRNIRAERQPRGDCTTRVKCLVSRSGRGSIRGRSLAEFRDSGDCGIPGIQPRSCRTCQRIQSTVKFECEFCACGAGQATPQGKQRPSRHPSVELVRPIPRSRGLRRLSHRGPWRRCR